MHVELEIPPTDLLALPYKPKNLRPLHVLVNCQIRT